MEPSETSPFGPPAKAAGCDEYFREIADDAPAILWVTDPEGYCTYLSRQWYEFTGQTPREALGYGWTDVVHPDDKDRSTRIYLDALKRREQFQLDYRLRRGDGVYRDAVDAGRPRFDERNQFLGYVGCVLDITERKELERQLLHAQKMEAIGRLAAGIAHDFNNLLTAIAGHAHLISDDLAEGSPMRDDVREIQHAVQRASALTQQLLAFSRQQVLQPRPMDVNTAVRETERMFRRVIGADIELRLDLADTMPTIRADMAQISQVILNLVINARDAMPKGGVLSIVTRSRPPSGKKGGSEFPGVALIVADTGVGMDDDTRRHIFEPFFTTKAQGSGLGLATVHGIVEQSGGEILVDSEPGKGATFTVLFPACGDATAGFR